MPGSFFVCIIMDANGWEEEAQQGFVCGFSLQIVITFNKNQQIIPFFTNFFTNIYIYTIWFSFIIKGEFYMICKLLARAQQGEEEAMLELVGKFQPLLWKYATKLRYDDAYEDCRLFFIELVKTMDLKRLNDQKDQTAIADIKVSVKNFYCKKICKILERRREIAFSELTEEQRYGIEAEMSETDETDFFLEFGIDRLLNEQEQRVLYLVYAQGYTTAEIARNYHKSRQAVNQLKRRTLKKLREIYGEVKKGTGRNEKKSETLDGSSGHSCGQNNGADCDSSNWNISTAG